MRSLACLTAVLTLVLISLRAEAKDWSQFRGPGGLGTSDETNVPFEWSSNNNVVWRTAMPGPGGSSPIVVGNRVFLTSYSGYALTEEYPGDQSDLMRHVVCLDRKTGDVLWQKEFAPRLPESGYSGGNNTHHGYATSTPVSDGERLYVFFGKSGVYCLDLDGKQLWHALVGDGTRGWGSGASPVLHQDLVIINASVESRAIYALDKLTGKVRWQINDVKGVWNTPLLVDNEAGDTELVVSFPQVVRAFDPADGSDLWHCDGIPDRGYVCPSAIAHDGIVYLIGGRKNTAIAIRSGGKGDVTDSHVLWNVGKGSNVSSPVYHQGHIYWFHEKSGTAICLDAKTGRVVFQERLLPRPRLVYASTTAADGRLYAMSQYNGAYVIEASPEFKLLAHNKFELDESRSNASPVVHAGQLLLRTDGYAYCIGN